MPRTLGIFSNPCYGITVFSSKPVSLSYLSSHDGLSWLTQWKELNNSRVLSLPCPPSKTQPSPNSLLSLFPYHLQIVLVENKLILSSIGKHMKKVDRILDLLCLIRMKTLILTYSLSIQNWISNGTKQGYPFEEAVLKLFIWIQ